MKGIKSIYQTILFLAVFQTTVLTHAQIPDPDLGLRADWMRGTYGLNWKPAQAANGRSELETLTIKPFLEQISGLKTVDYIQLHLGESFIYSPVHLGPHELLESLWQGDTDENGNPVNLCVPRANIGRDPFLDLIDDVRNAGLKVQVYVNTANMLQFWRGNPVQWKVDPPDALPEVTERWINWCDTSKVAQAFINSQSYHRDPDHPERHYIFCYAEFVLKEYAIRYGDKIDAWLFDNSKVWRFHDGESLTPVIEDQRIYQAWADACHAGNPDAAIAFSNGPGSSNLVDNPFSEATLFCDYMFGHPFAGGKNLGDHPENKFSLTWLSERDGYVHTDDPKQTQTWDDKVIGHFDPPMSTSAWNSGKVPALTNEEFLEWYSLAILGGGAMSPGIPLLDRNGWEPLTMEDYALEQLTLLDSFLVKNQFPGSPNWARQETILPDAYPGQEYHHNLVQDIDFWDPEGDEITDLLIVTTDSAPSWLSVNETGPGTWTLSGIPDETVSTEYAFKLRLKDASGERDRLVKLRLIDPDAHIPLTGLTVYPAWSKILLGDTYTLTALLKPRDASDKSVSWSSSDTTIATVNPKGLVTSHDTGKVFITATTLDGVYTDECAVTVRLLTPVSAVAVSPDSLFLTTIGEKKTLIATVLPSDASDQSVSWSSNNTSVATVNSEGEVLASGVGSASITAITSDGGYSDSCWVRVSTYGTPNLALGGTATQSSTNFSGEALRAIDGNTDGTYANGSVTHTNAEAKPWWEVDLGAEYGIADIIIYGRTDDCCKARLSDFTVYVYDAGDSVVHFETFLSYPDPSISSHAGGVSGQRVRIVLNGSSYALSLAEVQVIESIPVDSLVVSPDSLLLTTIGETSTLGATVFPSNATNQRISWTSSDSSVVYVNNDGLVTALDTGSIIITAISPDGAYSDHCIVTVETADTTVTQIRPTDISQKEPLIYPNPANRILYYDFQDLEGDVRISVFSIFGKLVFIQETTKQTGQLDISGLSSGVYVMKIQGHTTVVTSLVKE